MNYQAHQAAGEALFALSSFSEGEDWLRSPVVTKMNRCYTCLYVLSCAYVYVYIYIYNYIILYIYIYKYAPCPKDVWKKNFE